MQQRIGTITRNTKETQITLTINLDGSGKADISTGIGFFDHMLNSFARHGLFDLTVKATGDLDVDCHHTIEDVGIVLGQAIAQAVGDKKSICRYGDCILPMDEALILCAIDLSGRPYLGYEASISSERVGGFDTEMAKRGYITVDKGSVTVNGVSLTVCNPTDDTFQVAIIPYTYEHTNFHTFTIGSVVNIEFDIIGKYISRMIVL